MLQKLLQLHVKLDKNDAVKFTDIRKITIRGAMREQVDYNPKTFSWEEYDQQPGLEQFYGQQPVGLGLAPDTKRVLSSSSIKKASKSAVQKWGKAGVQEAFHNIG